MPENETNETSGKWRKFLDWFSPTTIKIRNYDIPIEARPSNDHAHSDDPDIQAIIVNNQALNPDQRQATQEKLGARYWGSKDFDYIVPTDSKVTEAFKKKKIPPHNVAIRIKYASQERGLEEVLKNTSFFEWLSDKKELGYSVIRDVGSFYVVMIEGLPMDKALKDPNMEKRDAYLHALLDFVGEYYFKKEHVVENPEPGQAQHSVELWRETLLRLASKLPAETRNSCIDDIREAAGSLISILKESTPVTYSAPDAKLSNFIYVSDTGAISADYVAMSDRGLKEGVFSDVKTTAIELEMPKKCFDKYLALPFIDLGCLYETITRDPELKEIVPLVKDTIYTFLDTGLWGVQDSKKDYDLQKYWDPILAHAAFEFGRLYPIVSLEVKSANIRDERSKIVKAIREASPNL